MNKFFRIFGIVAVVVVLFAAIIASTTYKPSAREDVWDEAMTIGNLDAKNHFIIYSDLVCPYCIYFENAIVENEEQFQKYISENDILFEVRLSDYLYRYGESNPDNSQYSAVAAYCAKNEGKFWDYYNLAVSKVYNEFFKDSGKNGFAKLESNNIDYWVGIGEAVGLGEEFKRCAAEGDTLEEVKKTAEKTLEVARGMPYFKFNNFRTSGFDPSGGWEEVLMYFKAGLSS